MAVRLHMKLGFVPETDRLADSPDTIRTHEPAVGAVVRSKGALYLLATSRATGPKVRDATRLVADTIEHDYYYDESAGIRVCLEKAIRNANRRLGHAGDRFGLGRADVENGPIGVAVAVIRGGELYVSTIGPAEAYLVRQARLSTLPDPHRERGLPTGAIDPEVWRGEIAVGDSLILASSNLVARLGPDELKDAITTLHPQSAMEHLHHRFIAATGSGSDGAIAVEATEVASTTRHRALVPVRPLEPLAGAPDRSPIPLADSVGDGVAAVSASAARAKTAAGGAMARTLRRFQEVLPARGSPHRSVTPASSRVETQRRAAVAILALVITASLLGVGIWYVGGGASGPRASIMTASTAVQEIRDDLAKISGPGINLIRDDPRQAESLLLDAYGKLAEAQAAGVPPTTLSPLRAEVLLGLDAIYSVVPVASTVVFSFPTTTAADLGTIVLGPDGVPYVLDRATQAVYRVDLATKKATIVIRAGQAAAGLVAAAPRYLAVGGRDVLVLDARNVLWRWRPADSKGRGTLTRIAINGSASWGADIRGFGTFLRGDPANGQYNLYVIDPSSQQLLLYTPAADGSGFPGSPTGRLPTAQPVGDVDAMLIDGDIYFAEAGLVKRVVPAGAWTPGPIGDTALRPTSHFVALASYADRRTGILYAFDALNARIVAYDKGSGAYRQQFRLADGALGWSDLRSFYVVPGTASTPPTVIWISARDVSMAPLSPVPDTLTGGATASPSSSSAPASPPAPTTKPKATARPTTHPGATPSAHP